MGFPLEQLRQDAEAEAWGGAASTLPPFRLLPLSRHGGTY